MSNPSGLKLHGSHVMKDHRAHLGVSVLTRLTEKAYAMLICRCGDDFSKSRWLVLVVEWGCEMKCYLSMNPPGK